MIEVAVQDIPPLDLVCLSEVLRSESQGMNLHKIPEMWQRMMSFASGHQRQDENRYSFVTGDLPGREEPEAIMKIGLNLNVPKSLDLPDGFFHYRVPVGMMAVTTHVGSPMTIGQTVTEVFRDWLPDSGKMIRENLEMTIYPPGYDRNDPEGSFSYCLFIK